MATRTEKCKWCSAKLVVPIDAHSISCPRCRGITHLLPNNNNGYFARVTNSSNGYGVPSNTTYGINGGGVASPYGDNYNRYRPGANRSPWAETYVSPPPVHGRKRAVLCGVTYKEHPKRLDGSINDVLSMRSLLLKRLGFPDASVILLTEDEKDPSRIPTKMNIRRAMNWLVQGCQPGDSLVFHYSGHGSKVRDRNSDEVDGHDEALCPVDFETEGRILDDEMNATLINPLPRGVTLHAIIDTCFSGTFLDLPFMCRVNREGYYLWEDHRISYHGYKGTRGGLAISVSACDDHQTSGDTTAFTGQANGALTYSFTHTIENAPRLTYGQLLITMRKKIHGVQKAVAQNGSLAPQQDPQLSATEQFDIHAKQIAI